MTFTVPTEACQAQFGWSGVETSFPCGFPALATTDLQVQFVSSGGTAASTLALGLAYTVALDANSGNATVTPISAGMPAATGTVTITRNTLAENPTLFSNLNSYQADALTTLFDRAVMVAAECKRRLAVLEASAFGSSLVPANYVLEARAQRSIKTSADLPIRSTDSVLNVAVNAGGFVVPLPAANTRGGAPLTFKQVSGGSSFALSAAGSDTMDGATAVTVTGAATIRPFVDGVNSGFAIGESPAPGLIANHTVMGNQAGSSALPTPIPDFMVINGLTISLGGSGNPVAAAGAVTPGTTTVGGATHNGPLYDNAGSLAELAVVNGGVVMFSNGGTFRASQSMPAGINFNSGNPTFSAQTGSGGVVLVSGATMVGLTVDKVNGTVLSGGGTAVDRHRQGARRSTTRSRSTTSPARTGRPITRRQPRTRWPASAPRRRSPKSRRSAPASASSGGARARARTSSPAPTIA
jgi:hypothetical protein